MTYESGSFASLNVCRVGVRSQLIMVTCVKKNEMIKALFVTVYNVMHHRYI